MSYVSLLKNLPELLSQPAGIAAIASLGIHGALGFLLPLMPVDENKEQASSQRQVGLMNLNAAEQARLPQVNPQPQSPQLGISSQVTLPNFATQPSALPPLAQMPALGTPLPPLGQLPIDKYPRVSGLPNANQKNNQKIDPRVAMGGMPPIQQYPMGGITPQNTGPVRNFRQQNPVGYTTQPPMGNMPPSPPENNPVPPPPSPTLNFGPPITVARTNEPTTDEMRRVSGIDDYLRARNWQQGSPDEIAGDNSDNIQTPGDQQVAAAGNTGTNQPAPNQPNAVGDGKTSEQLVAALRGNQPSGGAPSSPTTPLGGERTSGELLAALRNSRQPGAAPTTPPNNQPNQPYSPSAGAVQAITNLQTLQDLQQQNPGAKISTNIRRTINNQGGGEGNASGYMVVKDGRIAQVVWINKPSSVDGEQAVKNSLSEDVKGNNTQIIPFDVRLSGSGKPARKPNNNPPQPTTSNNQSPQAQPNNNSPASRLRQNSSPRQATEENKQPQQRENNPVREIRRSNPGNSESPSPRPNSSPQAPTEANKPPQQQDRDALRERLRPNRDNSNSAASSQPSNSSSQSSGETKQPQQQENKSWRERLRPEQN